MNCEMVLPKYDAKIYFSPYTEGQVPFCLDLRQRTPAGVSAGQRTGAARVLAEVGWR